ncbi:phosphate starvation-inducible PhoH-like protein [Natranaerovirga hydrolytica]|uniref:PhoH-like protein n=2 Tax=Natranaerovirga hydrolytica TaxID=680378 RepID=A0A4V2Q1M8_9FIRM|nr:phosphate starvation-inducible PhoH-like protein [Natranaerovirga hydrolytica]
MEIPNEHIINIFGQFDINIKKIEKELSVTIVNRGENIKIIGEQGQVEKAQRVLNQLLILSNKKTAITEQNADYLLSLVAEDQEEKLAKVQDDLVCMTIDGKQIRPKTLGQKEYIDLIRKNMIVFGVGPAGTGKTFLAMAMAITAFKNNEVNRIILTRPAIEAGERLGFLPGDLQSKIDPYLRPLYDALHQIMGPETYMKNIEKGLIEIAPLAYMRGRTLDNAFIVLDEAQNTTPAQMKMFLTRIGFNSKAIITGDITQKDLAIGSKSGLEEAIKVLNNIEGIGVSKLTNKDVVRHPLVQKIVKAYETYESKSKPTDKRKTNTKPRTNRKK